MEIIKIILKLYLLIILIYQTSFAQSNNWTKVNLPSNEKLLLTFADSSNGIIATFSDSTMYLSTNYGVDWLLKSNNPMNPKIIASTYIVTKQNEIICRVYSEAYEGPLLLKSENYGIVWDTLYFGGWGSEIWSIYFNNSNNAYYFAMTDYYSGNKGIYYTIDGGISWDYIEGSEGINAMAKTPWLVLNNNSLLIYSDFGRVFKSTNNGFNWQASSIDSAGTWFSGWTNDCNLNIYVIFKNTGVLKSDVNLLSWENLGLINKRLSSIITIDEQVFVSSDSLGVFKFNNKLMIWEGINDGLDSLNIIQLFSDTNGYLYARTRTSLYRTTTVVGIDNKDKTTDVNSYKLYQSYPNPFNPTTTISYTIPKRGLVQLKVYDILGKEIETLVNEEKPSGKYSVKFNGSNLPSGVYFYNLRINNFVQSRKMILLR